MYVLTFHNDQAEQTSVLFFLSVFRKNSLHFYSIINSERDQDQRANKSEEMAGLPVLNREQSNDSAGQPQHSKRQPTEFWQLAKTSRMQNTQGWDEGQFGVWLKPDFSESVTFLPMPHAE